MASLFEKRRRKKLAESTALVKGIREGRTAPEFPNLARFESTLMSDYEPHAKQRLLHEAIDERYVALIAGRRSGKTTGAGWDFGRRVARDYEEFKRQGGQWERPSKLGDETTPALEYWCVAPTYRLTGYQQRAIFRMLGGVDSDLILKWNASKHDLWLVGGIKISFRSADNPDALVAAGLAGIWIDEAARCKEDVWSENLQATLADRGGWCLFTSTPLGKNWLYHEVWQHTQAGRGEQFDGYFGLHFTTLDNTAVPALQEEAERARRELPEAVFLRNYMASFEAFAGKIYTEFLDDSTHIVSRIPFGMIRRRVAGVDWGFANPGVQLEAGIDHDDRIWVYREDYRKRMTVSAPPHAPRAECWMNHFKRARNKREVSRWWCDPSEPEHITQMHQNGIPEARAAANDVQPGIEAVATMLQPVKLKGAPGRGEPALFIHRGCRNLRDELSSYRYRKGSEKPVKEHDHACDALRYLVFSEHTKSDGGLARLNFSIFDNEKGAAA